MLLRRTLIGPLFRPRASLLDDRYVIRSEMAAYCIDCEINRAKSR